MSRFVRSYHARKLFLDCLELGDSESRAAQAAGGKLRNFKAWRDSDPDFEADWKEALEAGTDFIEDVATNRALTKSDPLMIMMLKARRPEKYDRGSKLELSGGINVEGSKTKLLNKIAKIQALGRVAAESNSEESEVSEAQPVLALPAPQPAPIRGSKRRKQAA